MGLSSGSTTGPPGLGAGSLLAALASFALLVVAGSQHTGVSTLYVFVLLVAAAGTVLGVLAVVLALATRYGEATPGKGVGVILGVMGFLGSGAVAVFSLLVMLTLKS